MVYKWNVFWLLTSICINITRQWEHKAVKLKIAKFVLQLLTSSWGGWLFQNFLTAWSDNLTRKNVYLLNLHQLNFNCLAAQYLRIFWRDKCDKAKSIRTSCSVIFLPWQKPINHQAAETHHPIYRQSGVNHLMHVRN